MRVWERVSRAGSRSAFASAARAATRGAVTAALLFVVLAAAGVAAGAAQAATTPLPPSQDPFYAVPSGISSLANGTILDSRSVSATVYGLPDLAQAWQVQYKSTDNQGNATADVATILIPDVPYVGTGPRPLVSYQTAEDGASTICAPSYALETGPQTTYDNSELETGIMELALARGWALVVPDYEGPDSDFLSAAQEGHAVLDGITAALSFAPAGLPADTPIGMWGYSGGSVATSVAAQLQSSYAPSLKLTGVALGGEVASLEATINAFSGSPLGGALAMGFAAVSRAYPSEDLNQYLNATGLADTAAAGNDCIAQAAEAYPELSIADIATNPDVLSTPSIESFLESISPLGVAGTPTAPVYDYHSINDEYAPIGPDRQLMANYCAAGVPVEHVESLLSDHITLTATGAPGAFLWLAGRFAGLPAPNDCSTIPPPGNPTLFGQAFGGHVPAPGSTVTGEPGLL